MATDYNKILLDKGYTQAQIDAMRWAANAWASNKDIVAAANTPQAVSTPKTDTTKTTKTNNSNATKANTNIAKPEYQWTGTVNAPTPSYQHQWEGNYVYNPTSWYYEKQSTPATSTSTSTSTPTTWTDKNASAREMWDSKSYQEQQNLLNKSPSLREKVLSIWWTIKTAPEEWTPAKTDTTWTTPSTEWDYQDNSPERMAQMVDNLERIYQSNPWLFDNEQAFRNAFINWVNRSPEQEAFLMDYFKNRQIYNEYDWYTSEKVWYMEAHGQCPQSYLNYVKNSNPQRYAEIMDSKDKTEKGIENDTYYSDLLKNSWFEDSSNLAWQKKEWLLVDENGDLIDDRMYHEMSAEERQYRDEINTLQAQNLKLEETLRYLDEDLIDQYPDADYSTIMLLRSDRWSKIQKEIASNNVTLTKLQWTVDYMQSERQQQDKAGQQTIANLQKNLWMYYDYSPEWMSELAQAQYAATNVTLDQADNWTDTQKQMALDSVLSDYFDKYGSIIQRSKSQVINDVMNYAKNNGVSLSQALEDNFLSQLRSKPLYSALSNGWLSPNVSFEKVWDTGYVLTVNPDGTYSIDTVSGTSLWTNWLYWFTDYTPISTEQKESVLNNFKNTRTEGSDWWQCWEFVNDYLQALWYDRLYDDPIDKKKAITNSKEATVWSVAVMESQKYPEYWHVAIVTDVQWDKVKLLESNRNNDEKVHTTRWVNKSDIAWYFDPSKSNATNWISNWYDPLLKEFFQKDPTKLTKDQWAKLKNMWYDERTYLSMRQNYLSQLAKEPDDATVKILDTLWYLMTNYPWRASLIAWRGTKYLPWEYWEKMWDYRSYVDYIKQNLTMDNLTKLKANGATFGSLTEWEWPRIEASATRLQDTMSEDKFVEELLDIYNTYARNAWMWTLTLDDINQMYGGKSSWVSLNAPSFIQSWQSTNIQGWDIDYDARLAEYNG